MNEFNSRISAQRDILKAVNQYTGFREPLLGLSYKAIQRWISKNNIDSSDNLPSLIHLTGEKLFFLANKSQEQITEDYKMISAEISQLLSSIRNEIKKYASLS